ncbi:hypothetical protein G6F65_020583 [Rhizopus arrhizus]|nr:hypothetical protein G6F65_020583 [Rhizopus arrhizus]
MKWRPPSVSRRRGGGCGMPVPASTQRSCAVPPSSSHESCSGQPCWAGQRICHARASAAFAANHCCARAACAPASISCGEAGTGPASIHRVIGSRNTLSVPVRKIAHNSQPQVRPHQVCSHDMLCRKPAFMPSPWRACPRPAGCGGSQRAAQRQHHVAGACRTGWPRSRTRSSAD